jgi:hypothetical protein
LTVSPRGFLVSYGAGSGFHTTFNIWRGNQEIVASLTVANGSFLVGVSWMSVFNRILNAIFLLGIYTNF